MGEAGIDCAGLALPDITGYRLSMICGTLRSVVPGYGGPRSHGHNSGEHRGVRGCNGFTLLEVLVAAAIAAFALSALFRAGLSAQALAQSSARYEQAIGRARSHLAMAVRADPLQAGHWKGDDGGGFSWRIYVTPVASTSVHTAEALARRGSEVVGLTLYSVTVSIDWRDAAGPRQVRLATEQIGSVTR